MHILILPSWYPDENNPVKGCFFREQAEALARSGHRVSVFPYYADAEKGVYTERREICAVMTEYAIHYKSLPLHMTYFRLLREMTALVRAFPRNERPDVIHVHSFYAARYGAALKKLFHIPMVITEHATWFERRLLSEQKLRDIKRDYAAADALIAVSSGLRDVIAPLYPREIRVVPNMVRELFFASCRRPGEKEPFRFVAVGSLDEKKGTDILLSAFAKVLAEGRKATLTLCGGGDPEKYRRQARELGISDSVRFTGQIDREACAAILGESHAFVLPSRFETFGVVYAEAMARGLPIIMTKTNAWRELVTEETGMAVDIEDIPALRDAMLSMMDHYDRYDPERIRTRCRERYAPEQVCARLTEIYSSLTAHGDGR